MPKQEGLKIKDARGNIVFLHKPIYRNKWRPVGHPLDMPAGFYSQTFHEDKQDGKDFGFIEYLTYWGPTRPTRAQFRRMKKMLRRSR